MNNYNEEIISAEIHFPPERMVELSRMRYLVEIMTVIRSELRSIRRRIAPFMETLERIHRNPQQNYLRELDRNILRSGIPGFMIEQNPRRTASAPSTFINYNPAHWGLVNPNMNQDTELSAPVFTRRNSLSNILHIAMDERRPGDPQFITWTNGWERNFYN